jgi:hypothetical protein
VNLEDNFRLRKQNVQCHVRVYCRSGNFCMINFCAENFHRNDPSHILRKYFTTKIFRLTVGFSAINNFILFWCYIG